MYLTLANLFKRTVPGHIFRGKSRLIKPVSKRSTDSLLREYEREEKIMLLLRHPYLSLQESAGHAKELCKTEKKMRMWHEKQMLTKMKLDVSLKERLEHLKVKDVWD